MPPGVRTVIRLSRFIVVLGADMDTEVRRGEPCDLKLVHAGGGVTVVDDEHRPLVVAGPELGPSVGSVGEVEICGFHLFQLCFMSAS